MSMAISYITNPIGAETLAERRTCFDDFDTFESTDNSFWVNTGTPGQTAVVLQETVTNYGGILALIPPFGTPDVTTGSFLNTNNYLAISNMPGQEMSARFKPSTLNFSGFRFGVTNNCVAPYNTGSITAFVECDAFNLHYANLYLVTNDGVTTPPWKLDTGFVLGPYSHPDYQTIDLKWALDGNSINVYLNKTFIGNMATYGNVPQYAYFDFANYDGMSQKIFYLDYFYYTNKNRA